LGFILSITVLGFILSIAVNYEKSLFNISVSDIDVNDKVRIKLKGKFRKGTDARYTDEVYTVTKVRGNSVTLDDDKVYKRSSLLIVPPTTVSNENNVIVRVQRQNKIDRNIQQEGLDVANIVLNKRRRDILLNTLDNNIEKPLQVINAPKKIMKSISKSISKTQRIPSRPIQSLAGARERELSLAGARERKLSSTRKIIQYNTYEAASAA
jgi:hypothetical protein